MPTLYNVSEFLQEDARRDPKRRLDQLLTLTGMAGSFTDEKINRPRHTFETFVKAQTLIKSAMQIPTEVSVSESFLLEVASSLDGNLQSDQDFDQSRKFLTTLRASLGAIKKNIAERIPLAKEALGGLTTDSKFCLYEELQKLEAAKNRRRNESRAATEGLSKALDTIINEVRNRGWGENNPKKNLKMTNFPRFSYLTDIDAHIKEQKNAGADPTFHTSGCKCPPITQMSKWAKADWAKETLEVEGHRGQQGDPTDFYCLRPEPGNWHIRQKGSALYHLQLCRSGEEVEQLGKPDTQEWDSYTHSKATWDAAASKVNYPNIRSELDTTAFKLIQLGHGLCYEWSVERVLNEQWDRLGRTVEYLAQVKKAGEDCQEPLKKIISYLESFVALCQELDILLDDCCELMLITGSSTVVQKSLLPDVKSALMKMQSIVDELGKTYDKSVHRTPDINISRYYQDFVVSAADWSKSSSYCPRVLTSGNFTSGPTYRAIPYPWYVGGQPGWIMPGFTDLNFTRGKDMKVSLTTGDRTSSGFYAEMGVTLDKEQTECWGVAFSWILIPSKYKTAFQMGICAIDPGNNSLNSSRSQEVQISIAEGFANTQLKFEALITAVYLNKSKDWKISVEPKRDGSKLAVKFNATGNTIVDYASVQWIAWDPKQLSAVSKTFTTGKVVKDGGHKEYFDFGGVFTSRPKFIYGIRGFSLDGWAPLRLASGLEELTKDRAVVNVWTWDDTIFSSVTVTCIAISSS